MQLMIGTSKHGEDVGTIKLCCSIALAMRTEGTIFVVNPNIIVVIEVLVEQKDGHSKVASRIGVDDTL